MSEKVLSIVEITHLVTEAFVASRVAPDTAAMVAEALVKAEVDGKFGHGLSRIGSYAAQSRSGKVDGFAKISISHPKPAVMAVDAASGFAYPAMTAIIRDLPALARQQGIAMAGVHRSHHCGVAGHHVEAAAEQGMIALLFANTPSAMAPWGGRTALFGTNPIAFAAPVADAPPLVIDLATSAVARGGIMKAAASDQPIPLGWALDADGQPTTDAKAALDGTMVPMAEAKGAALALMIEVLAAALTGANFAYEAASFLSSEGDPPHAGQLMLMIDAGALGVNAAQRMAEMAMRIADDGARLPGAGRITRRQKAAQDGLTVSAQVMDTIQGLITSPL
ncbi:MAG: Ldh family oxidoreductase [Proteobacteria bacterium]|jgi:(2R)-3-sulfolactate dehydrogenase (NADP+)|nr:Ldh family oxidoreductase [Pseudomonadota bacterium]